MWRKRISQIVSVGMSILHIYIDFASPSYALWNLGNTGNSEFLKQFFVNKQNLCTFFYEVTPPLIANFAANGITEISRKKKPRAAIFVLVFWVLNLAPLSCVFLTRDARWKSIPRARKLVRATLNRVTDHASPRVVCAKNLTKAIWSLNNQRC